MMGSGADNGDLDVGEVELIVGCDVDAGMDVGERAVLIEGIDEQGVIWRSCVLRRDWMFMVG